MVSAPRYATRIMPTTADNPSALSVKPLATGTHRSLQESRTQIETMVRRGDANTRERDFADVWLLTRVHAVYADDLATAIAATAAHRGTAMTPLAQALSTLPQRRQRAWSAFVRRAGIEPLPQTFVKVVDDIRLFADPLLAGQVPGRRWNPSGLSWDLTPGI